MDIILKNGSLTDNMARGFYITAKGIGIDKQQVSSNPKCVKSEFSLKEVFRDSFNERIRFRKMYILIHVLNILKIFQN